MYRVIGSVSRLTLLSAFFLHRNAAAGNGAAQPGCRSV